MDTYSPRRMSRCTSLSAWVSTSSAWNTLRMPPRAMTLVGSFMGCSGKMFEVSRRQADTSFQLDPIIFVPLAGIGQDHPIAGFQSAQHLHAIDRGHADTHR